MQKICPVCQQQFEAHPNAIYCTITCANRAAYHRRSARSFNKATIQTPNSPYAFIYDNVTAEVLTQIYNDVLLHAYDRDIRINGPLPPNVPRPTDVYLIDAGDHHLVYHRSRELVLP
jgi:hypothetical protein